MGFRVFDVRSRAAPFTRILMFRRLLSVASKDVVDFSVQLLEKKQVAVVPGVAFGTNEHVRISYAASMDHLEKALNRIEDFMSQID